MEKNKSIIFLILFLLIIFLIGCTTIPTKEIEKQSGGSNVVYGEINFDEKTIPQETIVDKPIKTDKCSSAYYSSFSMEEVQAEVSTCYSGKYFDYSVQMDDVSICNEIVTGDYLGLCYANFAIIKQASYICEKTPIIEYEAKGYYNKLNSKDICYMIYIAFIRENYCHKISNEQMKKKCEEVFE